MKHILKEGQVSRKGLSVFLCLLICSIAWVLFSCTPQQRTEQASDSSAQTETLIWSIASDCASCHETEAESLSTVGTLAHTHTEQNLTCINCHGEDKAALEKAHANYATKGLPEKLRKTSVEEALCSSCHQAETLLAATAESVALTDKNGTVVNPHNLPTTEGHSDINCFNCHKTHESTSFAESSQALCEGCHHEHIYECGTCHP